MTMLVMAQDEGGCDVGAVDRPVLRIHDGY